MSKNNKLNLSLKNIKQISFENTYNRIVKLIDNRIKSYLNNDSSINDNYVIIILLNLMQLLEDESNNELRGIEKKNIILERCKKNNISLPINVDFLIDTFVSISQKDYDFDKERNSFFHCCK
jgi:hypothetical protein